VAANMQKLAASFGHVFPLAFALTNFAQAKNHEGHFAPVCLCATVYPKTTHLDFYLLANRKQ
jgi:hypothetical protein